MKKSWLKLRPYTHLNNKVLDYSQIARYVQNDKLIAKHSFYPMLHYTLSNKKFDREREKITFKKKYKNREVYYSAHIDSQIYAYYAYLLNKSYEQKFLSKDDELNKSVTSYRKIPSGKYDRNKCNIDFAKDVFDFIKENTIDKKSVLLFDITGFFDNLNHKILKKNWIRVICEDNEKSLPDDHYNIYKSVTGFSYVDRNDVFKIHGIKFNRHVREKQIETFFKNAKEFREKIREKGLIKTNKKIQNENGQWVQKDFGISQGTPISAVLSNIYMLDFDKEISNLASTIENAMYRRYSDDIIFICNKEDVDNVKTKIIKEIGNVKLKINYKKSEEYLVELSDSKEFNVFKIKDNNKYLLPIQYLGFEFDGKKVSIRSKSLSGYYKKVKKVIRRCAVYALYAKIKKAQNPKLEIDDKIFRAYLHKRLGHMGSQPRFIYIDGKKTNQKHWGNYYRYATKASEILESELPKKQMRNHTKIIDKKIEYYEQKFELSTSLPKKENVKA